MKLLKSDYRDAHSIQADLEINKRFYTNSHPHRSNLVSSSLSKSNLFHSNNLEIELRENVSDLLIHKFINHINVDPDTLYIGSSFNTMYIETLQIEEHLKPTPLHQKKKAEKNNYSEIWGKSTNRLASKGNLEGKIGGEEKISLIFPIINDKNRNEQSETMSQKTFLSANSKVFRFPFLTYEKFCGGLLSYTLKFGNFRLFTIFMKTSQSRIQQDLGFCEIEEIDHGFSLMIHKLYIFKVFRKSNSSLHIHKALMKKLFFSNPKSKKLYMKILTKYSHYKSFLLTFGFRLAKTIRLENVDMDLMLLKKENFI